MTGGNVPAFAYVSTATTLTTYSIDSSTGELTPLAGAPLAFPASTPTSGQIAIDPSGQLLYVIQASSVYGYAINPATGALTAVPGSPFAVGVGPTALAFDAAGTHLYIAGGELPTGYVNTTLTAYSVASSGALTSLASYSVIGKLSTMATAGNYLYVAALDADAISVYSIGSTGELSATGPLYGTNPGPYSIAIDPSGAVLYVANGSVTTVSGSSGGYISTYTINSSTGALTPVAGNPTPVTPNGAISIDPTGKFLFVPITGGVAVFAINTATGAFATIPGSPFPDGALPAAASFDPRSRSVYVVNAGAANVSEFSLANSGTLTPLPGSPVTVGSTPTYMAVVGP
jgi:6-phosphogluconolactonase